MAKEKILCFLKGLENIVSAPSSLPLGLSFWNVTKRWLPQPQGSSYGSNSLIQNQKSSNCHALKLGWCPSGCQCCALFTDLEIQQGTWATCKWEDCVESGENHCVPMFGTVSSSLFYSSEFCQSLGKLLPQRIELKNWAQSTKISYVLCIYYVLHLNFSCITYFHHAKWGGVNS